MQNAVDNRNDGIRITLVGMVANVILIGIKFAGGTLGKSTALVADAFHSLSDVLTDIVALFTHRIGQKPRDEGHPYGHGRAETLGAAVIGISIIAVALGLLRHVVLDLASIEFLIPEWIATLAAVLSVLVKEGLFQVTKRVGESIHSPILIANAWHHRSDAITSIASLIGILSALMGFPVMDPLAAVFVAFMIGRVGYNICGEAFRDLMDSALDEEQTDQIRGIIEATPGVKRFHELRTRRIGGEILIDVHILVDPFLSVTEGHYIAEQVRHNLNRTFPNIQGTLVHIDAEEDPEEFETYVSSRAELRTMIDPLIKEILGVCFSEIRVHYLGGKNIVEVFLKVEPGPPKIDEIAGALTLKSRLEQLATIDKARIYFDFNF